MREFAATILIQNLKLQWKRDNNSDSLFRSQKCLFKQFGVMTDCVMILRITDTYIILIYYLLSPKMLKNVHNIGSLRNFGIYFQPN